MSISCFIYMELCAYLKSSNNWIKNDDCNGAPLLKCFFHQCNASQSYPFWFWAILRLFGIGAPSRSTDSIPGSLRLPAKCVQFGHSAVFWKFWNCTHLAFWPSTGLNVYTLDTLKKYALHTHHYHILTIVTITTSLLRCSASHNSAGRQDLPTASHISADRIYQCGSWHVLACSLLCSWCPYTCFHCYCSSHKLVLTFIAYPHEHCHTNNFMSSASMS